MSSSALALALTLTLGAASPEPTPDPAELWVRGGTAFKQGDFAKAAQLYEGLAQGGFASGQVYYNLGNAYLRAGRLGAAIAAYRRSARELPRDEDVQANLAFARQKVQDAVPPPAPSPVQRTLFFWHYLLCRRELVLTLALVNLAFWAALGARLWRRDSTALRWATLTLGLVLAALALSWGTHALHRGQVAVVLASEAQVRAGIGAESVVRFVLHEGTEAVLLDTDDGWARIALSDGKQGWLPRDAVGVIDE